ncbi:DUF3365 domain-containing protein [Actibacterium sp. 188UL27-1]|uniref:Tll0287-like domain-containing protein n=1 Tax=Actibacterium sp. 188UL27-1 TaxID=2786961 RepID=UPI00195CD67E|nr:DUF3365 domain-containing protein [Actibacterium sp. 188UL27-1]MBM7070275.1 DUF3365 domain-containing protein [Actibacterium sp. 188UL27-1]
MIGPVKTTLPAIALAVLLAAPAPAQQASEELDVALSLATMLQSARQVIGTKQDLINDPDLGDKGLTGDEVLKEAIQAYLERTDENPISVAEGSLKSDLLRAQMAAIREVIDENQGTINRPGIGFKGFVPATFARLVNERFGDKVGAQAAVKVTAPPTLVRNRKSRPDAWETQIIADHLLSEDWRPGSVYHDTADLDGRAGYRVLVPEYYGQACLTCHGGPKGEIDMTGYPKEGGALHDLGGVISITIFE